MYNQEIVERCPDWHGKSSVVITITVAIAIIGIFFLRDYLDLEEFDDTIGFYVCLRG